MSKLDIYKVTIMIQNEVKAVSDSERLQAHEQSLKLIKDLVDPMRGELIQ